MNKGEAIAKDTSMMGLAVILFTAGVALIQDGQIYSGTILFVAGFGILAAKYYMRENGDSKARVDGKADGFDY